MTNAQRAKEVRDKQKAENTEQDQKALASKGTQTKESVEITKLKEELSNTKEIIKDKDELLEAESDAIVSYKKEIDTLNAMLEQKTKEIETLKKAKK